MTAPAYKDHYQVLILGGGTAGITVAATVPISALQGHNVVSAAPVGDVLVREPFLGGREVTVEQRFRDGRQLVQDLGLVHTRHPTDQ